MPMWLKTKVTKLQLKGNCKELKNNYYWLCMPTVKKRLLSEINQGKKGINRP